MFTAPVAVSVTLPPKRLLNHNQNASHWPGSEVASLDASLVDVDVAEGVEEDELVGLEAEELAAPLSPSVF